MSGGRYRAQEPLDSILLAARKQRCQEPLFSPDRLKVKTNTAQQAVQADPNRERRMPSRIRAVLRLKNTPIVLGLLLAVVVWGAKHLVDRVTMTPLLEYSYTWVSEAGYRSSPTTF